MQNMKTSCSADSYAHSFNIYHDIYIYSIHTDFYMCVMSPLPEDTSLAVSFVHVRKNKHHWQFRLSMVENFIDIIKTLSRKNVKK